VGGVTTDYLVDTVNPTGYAQVVDELVSGAVTRTYAYGLERISENQIVSSAWTPSFYGYDGHGSVRQLTNSAGVVTDTYDYDAFGNLANSTGSTPNNYLFAGEQYDPVLGLYYNRARYMNTTTGRFASMDTDEGNDRDPLSLHKYLYAEADPADNTDASGNEIDEIGSFVISNTVNSLAVLNFQVIVAGVKSALRDDPKDLWLVPKEDYQTYGRESGWRPGTFPSRSILYELERKDGGLLHNPSYNWTISEHQTNAALADPPYGTTSHDGGWFCDGVSPRGAKVPIQSDQTFTISPQPGKFNPANENDDVFVHTGNGDFGTLRIYMSWHAVTINGFNVWKGAADDDCNAQ
jgi:RHS repeat-associated protein